MKKIALTLFVITALTLTGCEHETAGAVKEEGQAKVVQGKKNKDQSEQTPDEGPSTAKLGDTVTLGDWDVKVTKVTRNANQAIANANQFNEKPRGQYLLVDFTATYTGAERTADAQWDLSWSFTTNTQNVLSEAVVVTPLDNQTNQNWGEARQGGTVKGSVAFDIKPDQIDGGLISVEAMTEDFETVYADFAL